MTRKKGDRPMKLVKCESCGKTYDYEREESCPFCGTFNVQPSAKTGPAPLRPMPGPSSDHRREQAFQPRAARRKGNAPALAVLAVVLFGAVIISLATNYVNREAAAGNQAEASREVTKQESAARDVEWVSHDFGEEFPLGGGAAASVSGGAYLGSEDGLTFLPEGMMCLYLDLTVTGGSESDVFRKYGLSSYLWSPEETVYPGVKDAAAAKELENYDVTATDWTAPGSQDPMTGQLVFLVPEDVTDWSLCVEEYGEDGTLRYVHELPFYLES